MAQLGSLFGQVPVFQEQSGIVVRHADHAFLPCGDGLQSLRVQQLDGMAGLRETRRAGTYRARLGLAQVVRELRHADRFIDVHTKTLAPLRQHFIREMFARAHAVTQAGHVGLGEIALLHDLAIDGRHTHEDGGAMFLDEARPSVRIVLTFMHDDSLAEIQRVHQSRTQHIGPIEFARVHDAVTLGGEVEPISRSRCAADHCAVRMQYALGIARRA